MIQKLAVRGYEISGLTALDPIQVYWEDFAPGQGRVTITCYGEAWTAYWPAMGGKKVKEFFADCNDHYLARRLQGAQFQNHTADHETYLRRIIQAIKQTPPEGK